jgi:translation initiation factor 6 (eIF-6)
VQWYLIYLLDLGEVTEEVTGARTCQLPTSFWAFTRFGRKVVGNNSIGLFPKLTIEELLFLHHEYYSIFLLQQEASALSNTVVINNNGIVIHFSLV